jgi:hypothetical protein
MSRQKRYGHGRWPRKQLYAIVAHYWATDRSPEWVAAKLGVGPVLVAQIYEYLAERDGEPSVIVSRSDELAAQPSAPLTAEH